MRAAREVGALQRARADSKGFRFEVVDKPWFGPRKRGKALLLESPLYGQQIRPEEFIDYLRDRYPRCFRDVEWIRFHRCSFHERRGHSRGRLLVVGLGVNIYPNV